MDEKNFSQTVLGEMAEIHRSKISKILSGVTKEPRRTTLKKIADALEIDLDWLKTGEGEQIPKKFQSFDMSGSGKYQVSDEIQGNMVMGDVKTTTETLQLTVLERSLIELNRAMGSENNLKKWLREITQK